MLGSVAMSQASKPGLWKVCTARSVFVPLKWDPSVRGMPCTSCIPCVLSWQQSDWGELREVWLSSALSLEISCDFTVQGAWPAAAEKATWDVHVTIVLKKESESESRLVESDALQPHGLYSPWNFPGRNTGVDSCFLLRGSPQPGIEPRPPTLQMDSIRCGIWHIQ